jgi:hypothetical protein
MKAIRLVRVFSLGGQGAVGGSVPQGSSLTDKGGVHTNPAMTMDHNTEVIGAPFCTKLGFLVISLRIVLEECKATLARIITQIAM